MNNTGKILPDIRPNEMIVSKKYNFLQTFCSDFMDVIPPAFVRFSYP